MPDATKAAVNTSVALATWFARGFSMAVGAPKMAQSFLEDRARLAVVLSSELVQEHAEADGGWSPINQSIQRIHGLFEGTLLCKAIDLVLVPSHPGRRVLRRVPRSRRSSCMSSSKTGC